AALWVSACGAAIPQVARTSHPTSGGALPTAVDIPPPAARIQFVPPRPASHCRWADGQWLWRDNEWLWQDGAWLVASKTCHYADPLFVWVPGVQDESVLFYTHGQWYNVETQSPCTPPPPC